MGIVSLYFSLWIRKDVGLERADSIYGVIVSVSMAIVFVASPFLGAISDHTRRRMPFLIFSTVVCVLCTALLGRITAQITILCFIVANVMYQFGLQFYDALLPEVSTAENRGKISGLGVGLGYLGSFLAVVLGIVFGTEDLSFLFLLVAILFFVLSLPCFFFVRETSEQNRMPLTMDAVWASVSQVIQTFKNARQQPALFRFLIGRAFYSDVVSTVIAVMMLITVNVAVASGMNQELAKAGSLRMMMIAISCAVVGGLIWGWVTDRRGPKNTLRLVVWLWMATIALSIGLIFMGLSFAFFHVIACMVGVSLGGIWTADRPYLLKLAPKDRIGEFYGLYRMVGKFSAIVGPLIWAATTYVGVNWLMMTPLRAQGLGLVFLLLMMITSDRILKKLPD